MMEEFNAATIYWLISIGLLVGYIMDLVMIKRGVGLKGNIAGGVFGSVITGITVMYLGLYGPLIYAAVGAITILFLVNVFSFHQEHKAEAQAS